MTFRELTVDNPLLIEFKRAVRRFFGVSKHSTINAMILVISCLLYGLLLLITISNREAMSPVAIIYIQTFLFCLVIPSNLHGAVAGERERRSWDLLLAAPIENSQIVIGKLMSGLAAVALTFLLMLPPTLIAWTGDFEATIAKVFAAEAISIGFAIALSAVTLFISARSKRAYAAQLITYGFLFATQVVYIVFVQVILAAGGGSTRTEEAATLMFLHPFFAIGVAWWPDQMSNGSQSFFTGVPHLLAFCAIAVVLTWITIRTLQAADGEDGRKR